MSSRSLDRAIAIIAATFALGLSGPPRATLRVCADPNNLPFSNDRMQGFENRIAELVARDANARIEYVWWAQRRGYVRNTFGAGACDVWMGVPTESKRMLVTRPYYRSSYVWVARRGGPRVDALDDPALRRMRIGVQLVGDDGQNSPPAHALAARNLATNVVGYSVYGDYGQPNPPAGIVDAVARGDVDVAAVWGPVAGYFAAAQPVALELTAARPQPGDAWPFTFDISVGVARRLPALRDTIDRILARRRADIDRILDRYHVPRM